MNARDERPGLGRLRIGVSGWTRPDWERLWPESGDSQRLARLARTFGCLEVDTTRFATPAARTVARWSAALAPSEGPDHAAPEPCRLVVEVPATLLDGAAPEPDEVQRFVAALRPLVRAKRLGAALARFDARLLHGPAELRRLGRIAAALEPLPLALEVRHPSWWEPRALDGLRGIGWSLAHVDVESDWHRIPARHAPTGPLGLLRLVGRGRSPRGPVAGPDYGPLRDAIATHVELEAEPSDHRYPPAQVGVFAQRARAIAREVDECFVIAANVVRGQALATAFELRWLCEARGPLPPWPTLRAAFPDLSALDGAPPVL